MAYPDGISPLVLHGRGRDIRMDPGEAVLLDTATLDVIVDTSDEPVIREASVPGLAGLSAMSGYRRNVPHAPAGSLLALLLDEVPTVTLISGSALARTGRREVTADRHPPVGTCAGWIPGGVMVSVLGTDEPPYFGEGPPAPAIDDQELPDLPIGGMRRRRRLDVRDGRRHRLRNHPSRRK